jgi:hypothetical protein
MVVENGPTDPIPQVKEEGKVILVANYLSLGSLKMVVSLRTKTHPLGSSQEEATKTSPVRPNTLGESPTLICCWTNQFSPAMTAKGAKTARWSFLRTTGWPRAKSSDIVLKCGTLSMAF